MTSGERITLRSYTVDYESIPLGLWFARSLRTVEDLVPGNGHADFALGRHGLTWLGRAMGWRAGDRFLLPAFVSPRVVEPFVRSGIVPDFYAVNEDLSVDLDDLLRRLRPGVRGGVVVHYFGWPQPLHVRRWLQSRGPEFGVWVEDLTHAFLSRPRSGTLGTDGDVALASCRKLIPCPDGAVLAFQGTRFPRPRGPAVPAQLSARSVARFLMVPLAGLRRLRGVGRVAAVARWRLKQWVGAGGDETERMSPISRHLIERFDTERSAGARRANAARLAVSLRKGAGIEPLWDVDDGVVPMALPVRVPRRDALRRVLAARGIQALNLWPRPTLVPAGRFPAVDRLADELLCFPVDERYGSPDMDFIANSVAEVATRDPERVRV